jgi:histidinol-phosphatase (PHP family)
MNIPLDYHMHSTYSEDGSSAPEQMCRQAILLGIPEIGFSEHWDVGPNEKNPRFFQPEPWFEELERLRTLFSGKLIIRAGVEIAEPHLYVQETAEVQKRVPFDYVIGSVHWVGSNFMFDEHYFRQHTADEVYTRYFSELERMVRQADIDIVAHLDIPARTAIPILGYDPLRYKDQICNILKIIIHRGLALDVNAVGFRKPSQNLMPDPQILNWFSEMGGKNITLGSDAHETSQVGLHLGSALKTIHPLGLTRVTRFELRHPQHIPIP